MNATVPATEQHAVSRMSRNGNGHVSAAAPEASILIVDDRDDKLLALEAVLSGLKQPIVKARSGKEALRHLLQKDFAVILLDVAMPGMDGFETASLIRRRPQTEHTPILFVTSLNAAENNIARGYSLGAVDYILSPIVPEVLRTKVSVFVELYKKTEQVRHQSERLRQIEQAEHRRQLAAAADRLEAETKRSRFFTLSIDLLAIADFNGRLLQSNPTWEKTLGWNVEELRAMSGLDLVHPGDHSAMLNRMNALQEGATVYFEGRYRCRDGSYKWLAWTAAPFVEERLLYIFARDITARRQAEDEIRTLNYRLEGQVAELSDINKELEAFSYSISHDLRAPLRAMQGFAHMLVQEHGQALGNEGRELAQRIVKSSMYLDTLLHDLLDYSRLARSQLEPGTVVLEALLSEVKLQLQREIEERKAVIEMESPLLPLFAHLPTVRQVLSNLICNAIKFVDAGTAPRVRIRTERCGSLIRVWVEDNGIGIPPEHHNRIFGLFERLHSSRYPGTGVGLALVRKGVERMGGRAGVESEVGQGSRFWIELPDQPGS